MIFHMGFELPKPPVVHLDHEAPSLTEEEVRIIKKQICSNSVLINDYVDRLELFVRKEKYPPQAIFLEQMRRRLDLLMEENDTFREVLWKHFQAEEMIRRANPSRLE